MATHSTELEHALKTLKQLTGISLEITADTPEEDALALTQVRRLCSAYRDKYNHGRFLQDLLTRELPMSTILEEARRLHLSIEERRVLFVFESKNALHESVTEILKLLFPTQISKALIPVSETRMAIAYTLKASDSDKEILQTAHTIIDTLSAEALVSVRLAYSSIFQSLTELHAIYEETALALQIGRLFYPEQNLLFSGQLGIGRLIINLPSSICESYLEEIWGSKIPVAMDEETKATVNTFLQNNLNIAETARQLHMHRNTLIYRINQVQKQTNLDLRNFEDAMQFKIATMILNRMNANEQERKDVRL